MKTIAITGCNRGAGLTLANYFLSEGNRVVGLNRSPSEITHGNYLEMQYSADYDEEEVESMFDILDEVDVLILNAGMYSEHSIASISKESMAEMLTVNSIAPLLLAKEYLCRASEKSKVIVMGSRAEEFIMKGAPMYSMSKMVLRKMFEELSIYFQIHEMGLSYLSLPRIDGENDFKSEDLVSLVDDIVNSKPRIEFRSIV